MSYDPEAIVRFFDAFSYGEYERHDASPEAHIKYQIHVRCLDDFVSPGSRVLEIGAGPGRFTELLARKNCQISVVDISPEQLRLNRERAEEMGYASSIQTWVEADICDMNVLPSGSFDSVIAFGGPFSYVLDQRGQALEECRRLMSPQGRLLLSVMSKWGTVHAFLHGIYDLPREEIDAVLTSGDVTAATSPSSIEGGHFFHMFTADELLGFLSQGGMTVEHVGASNAVSTKWSEILVEERHFETVLELEVEATRAAGALDMGTHIIAVASRDFGTPSTAR